MPAYEDLDKWQQREVDRYATDNEVDRTAAMKELHPDPEPEPANAVDPAGEDDGAAASARKARVTKS